MMRQQSCETEPQRLRGQKRGQGGVRWCVRDWGMTHSKNSRGNKRSGLVDVSVVEW